MKKINKSVFILITLFSIINLNADSYDDSIKIYNKLFDEIGQKRAGLDEADIDKTKDPFSLPNKERTELLDFNETQSESGYVLRAIIENIAKINNTWYRVGDKVGSYKLEKMDNYSVILKNGDEILDLKLLQGNKNVVIKTH